MKFNYWFEFSNRLITSNSIGSGFLPELRRIGESRIVESGLQILEWGAGLSTLLLSDIAANHGAHVVSVDHNADYQEAVRKQVEHPSSVTTYTIDLSGSRKGGSNEGLNYSTFPLILDKDFDLILIDGRRRMECALASALMCHEESVVLIHDYRRLRYQVALAIYDIIEDTDEFRAMRPKVEFLGRRRAIRSLYAMNPTDRPPIPGIGEPPSKPSDFTKNAHI